MTQADLIRVLGDALETARHEPRTRVGALTTAQRGWMPPTGGWSVDQVLEHIRAIDTPYLRPLRHWARERAPLAEPDEPWSGRWAGRLLVWSFQRAGRTPTLRAYRNPEPRPLVLESLEAHFAEVQELMHASVRLAWRRIHFRSPLAAPLRLNLGDAYRVVVYHALRHVRQIDRIMAHPAFPQ